MTRVERYLAENGYTSCPGMLEILDAYDAWIPRAQAPERTNPDYPRADAGPLVEFLENFNNNTCMGQAVQAIRRSLGGE
jgi:hypothetical protein